MCRKLTFEKEKHLVYSMEQRLILCSNKTETNNLLTVHGKLGLDCICALRKYSQPLSKQGSLVSENRVRSLSDTDSNWANKWGLSLVGIQFQGFVRLLLFVDCTLVPQLLMRASLLLLRRKVDRKWNPREFLCREHSFSL